MPQYSESILLATTNRTKQDYLRWLLSGLRLSIITTSHVQKTISYCENGDSHLANAELKARAWSKEIQGIAIATDGGVMIPTLGAMWSSLNTHRFIGENATKEQRQKQLLELMMGQSGDERRISWSEAVAIADNGTVIKTWEEQGADGLLAEKPTILGRTSDFWIASLWYIPYLDKYYSELTKRELEGIGDHWIKLRPKVQSFLRKRRRELR